MREVRNVFYTAVEWLVKLWMSLPVVGDNSPGIMRNRECTHISMAWQCAVTRLPRALSLLYEASKMWDTRNTLGCAVEASEQTRQANV